jgi:hypothetical protein
MEDKKKALTDMMSEDEKSGLYIDKFKKESKEIFDNEVKPQIERAMKMKKETLEEAAQSIAIHCNGIFIPGANWQAERMYSEEQVLYILNKLHKSPHALMDVGLKEWFEQFKKK